MPDIAPSDPNRKPNPILALLGGGLERALNRIVNLDPDSKSRIAALDGHALTVDFKGVGQSMRIAVDDGRLRVGPASSGASALRIAATPGALLSLALARGSESLSAPGRIEIAGDAELARRLEQIAKRFEPDFDDAFMRVFGDVAGFQIARALRRALTWSRKAAHGFAHDTADYLTEESRDLVARPELENFLDDVDALRERGDRLEARIRRLDSQRGPRRG